MLLAFLVGVTRIETTIGCTISSVLIHYFTLASVFWMGAEAVLMFKKLIIVFGRISTTFIVIISLICWGMFSSCKCNVNNTNPIFIIGPFKYTADTINWEVAKWFIDSQ